ncbi:MAG: nucleotidyl transferase AbiEii/AbiGii toxin family protein [Candidatus Pacebacteria bacterium]|nr:nucleotidyl transferase AbiEii/AbiGii toxin family protein [Candidatus Paceibacterota bacterium]
MAQKAILSENQAKVLEVISQSKDVCSNFYLTGGTALAEFYLQHRFSEDLDFFSENEVDPQSIFSFLKSVKEKVGFEKIDSQQSFNRNLFFLHFSDEIIKTEFTYFPFSRVEKGLLRDNLSVDSLLDIAVNKIFTIYQKPRARDYIDIYFIIQKTAWNIGELLKKARVKFDWHIDLLQWGSQLLQAEQVKDYPKMIKEVNPKKWQEFFMEEARKIKKDITR